jgi:hypothetical protein
MNRVVRSAVEALVALCVMAMAAHAQTAPPPKSPAVTEAEVLAKNGRRLGGGDFIAMYVGNTLSGTTSDGDVFHVFVASASVYRMRFQGQVTEDKWNTGPDGTFCATAGADTTCTREILADQVIYSFNADGTLAGTARIRAGNAEGL